MHNRHIPGSGATRLGVFVGAAKYAAVGSVSAGAIFLCLSSKLKMNLLKRSTESRMVADNCAIKKKRKKTGNSR